MSAPPSEPVTWPVLASNERRVLGVLVEKAKTTPDAYPLSLNALVTGCNQKSNREPTMNLGDYQVEDVLAGLQKKGLVVRITGGRVERWRHFLYENWKVGKVDLALLAELLLRGPQTEGELRSRASRMEPIEDLDSLRHALKSLVDRKLAVYLSPEGRRGTTVTHGFHMPEELSKLQERHGKGGSDDEEPVAFTPPTGAAAHSQHSSPDDPRLEAAQHEIAVLKSTVDSLSARVTALQAEVDAIKNGLGL